MYLLTGAAGFIASYYLRRANAQGRANFILVDDFSKANKRANWLPAAYWAKVEREELWDWLAAKKPHLTGIIHLGARTDTTEFDVRIFDKLNYGYSQALFRYAAQRNLPFIYASSAATYGLGEQGYDDALAPSSLKPLNPYGRSKNDFDAWALEQSVAPPLCVGLKFFNVYGPFEGHKGRMASVVWHTYRQIKASGSMRLFRSMNPDYADGWQLRDFIYVEDLAKIIDFSLGLRAGTKGLLNVGTGQARSFWDLASATFEGLGLEPRISFMDLPKDLHQTYQYFTQADLKRLRAWGYDSDFYSLEQGIGAYLRFLEGGRLFDF